MKKKLLSAVMFTAIFLSACKPLTPKQEHNITVAMASAAASAIAMMENAEMAGGGIIGGAALLFVGAVAGAAEDEAHGGFHRHPYTISGNQKPDLPQELLLPDNPFESLGVTHNRQLNVFASEGGNTIFLPKLLNYDYEAFTKLSTVSILPGISRTEDQIKLFEFLRNQNMSEKISSILKKYENLETIDQFINTIPLAANEKEILVNVLNNYIILHDKKAPLSEIALFLNSEITKLLGLKALTKDQTALVVFLTVLKHSEHYWKI